MLTLYYRTPLSGIRRAGEHRIPWKIESIHCHELEANDPAPQPELVRACHNDMVDKDGVQVPVETLIRYNLREGLAAAFRAVEECDLPETANAKGEAA
ncbi:MAG: hypothetical protein WBL20_08770 [Sphingobium sp.]|uniref:hypothetical protein n=1 Tax=Sphingobium sp. TaxID=1912891 RepID=UPI003BAF6D3C